MVFRATDDGELCSFLAQLRVGMFFLERRDEQFAGGCDRIAAGEHRAGRDGDQPQGGRGSAVARGVHRESEIVAGQNEAESLNGSRGRNFHAGPKVVRDSLQTVELEFRFMGPLFDKLARRRQIVPSPRFDASQFGSDRGRECG